MSKLPVLFSGTISILALLLFLLPHTTIINRPLIGLHDMDNGHLLTTVYLWRTEGITTHHFAPIYSFAPGNINLRTWGVVGKNDRMYHASYPPLSFWLVYLVSHLPGVGITEAAAHLTSLGVFIVVMVFLFLYLYSTYNLPTALFGTGLFSFLPLSAYFFGGLVVADIVVFAFWIPSFVLLSFYLRFKKPFLAYTFFLSLGLAVLSEWLGLLTALSMCVYFLMKAIKSNQKHLYRFLLFGTSAASVVSLFVTASVYVSIATPQNLLRFLENKYLSRASISGLGNENGIVKTWIDRVVVGYFWRELTPGFFILLALLFMCSLLIWLLYRKRAKPQWLNTIITHAHSDAKLTLFFFALPPLLHTLLLSQFHYIHDYSALSAIPFLILLSSKLFFICSSIAEHTFSRLKTLPIVSIVASGLLLFLFYLQAQKTYHFLFVEQTGGWMTAVNLFTAVREVTNADDLILTNHTYMPDMWFYLRRNAVQWVAQASDIDLYKGYYPLFPRVFYVSDYKPFVDAVCGKRVLRPVAHGWLCQIK